MSRERRLQRAVDTINLYGGLMGAVDVQDAIPGLWVPNIKKWTDLEPIWQISRNRFPVYLAADVEAELQKRRERAGKSE